MAPGSVDGEERNRRGPIPIGIDFSLVIPTYNEKDNIRLLLDEVRRTLGDAESFEIIVVDDDSPDLTWNVVETAAAADPRIRLVRRRGVKGLSRAVIEGFSRSRGRFLGVMDADFSHDSRILPAMIAAVRDGSCDIAVGSRRIPGGGADKWPWYRKAFSNIATAAARRALAGLPLRDPMSGYFVLGRDVFERIKAAADPRGYKILLEICALAQPLRIKEIPFVFKDRKQGYSKLTLKVALEYLQMLRRLRRKTRKSARAQTARPFP